MKGQESLTNTVPLVPVQPLPYRTYAVIAPQSVNAACVTASIVNAALINVYEKE